MTAYLTDFQAHFSTPTSPQKHETLEGLKEIKCGDDYHVEWAVHEGVNKERMCTTTRTSRNCLGRISVPRVGWMDGVGERQKKERKKALREDRHASKQLHQTAWCLFRGIIWRNLKSTYKIHR